MFPTQSKVNRNSRLWLLPVVALAMLLVGYAVFAASTAQAQTTAGDVCIEGLVINWEEKPLAGWTISLTHELTPTTVITTVSASAPEDDDPYYDKKKSKKYPYEYPEEDPDLEKGEFEFTEDDIVDAFGAAVTGLYTASIELRPGWEGVTPTVIDFPIEVGQDGCVKIRFKMRRIVVVEVYKIDADHNPLGDWTIKAIPGPGNLFAIPQEEETSDPFTTTTGTMTPTTVITGGQAIFTLTPGLWIFTEMAPKQDRDEAPNAYVPVVPPNGRQELFIEDDLAVEDEPLRIVFKNELVTGCFIVRKVSSIPAPTGTLPTSGLGDEFNVAGWAFKLLRRDGSVARQGVTDGRGELRFDNLPLGPYVLVEEDRPGWNEVSPAIRDIDVTGNNCTPGEEMIVTFVNEQDDSGFCIEGRKIDANGGYGIFGWEIALEPLDEGGFDTPNVFTDGLGEFRFDFPRDDYRIPGAKYEVCEQAQDGWLPHTQTCQTVRLPEWPGACVQLEDFVNQQVGHSESKDQGKHDGGKGDNGDYGKGGHDNGYDNGHDNGYDNGHDNGYNGDGAKCSSYHQVKAGEGLYDIGAQYNVSPQAMLDANPEVRKGDELWVYVGQRICIP
jgi:hypothetical protein